MRGFLFDPENYTKRPPYGTGKPQGNSVFPTILGLPDTQYQKEKFAAGAKVGALVGFNYGMFGTVLKEQQAMFARDKFIYYSARCAEGTLKGGILGAMYVLFTTASCKLRGDKDDPLNHFVGGFGISSAQLVKGNWNGFVMYGALIGAVAAAIKSLYMDNFEFTRVNYGESNLTNCRYPELYLYRASAPPENLEKYKK